MAYLGFPQTSAHTHRRRKLPASPVKTIVSSLATRPVAENLLVSGSSTYSPNRNLANTKSASFENHLNHSLSGSFKSPEMTEQNFKRTGTLLSSVKSASPKFSVSPPPRDPNIRFMSSHCKIQQCPHASKLWRDSGVPDFVGKTWNVAPGSIGAKEQSLEWYKLAAGGKEYRIDPAVVEKS
ncbi:hypothetical protein RUND412_005299 [Rhizina undulata]